MQGLLQAWNFNQPEALRAFKLAEEADPSAAMVYFGQAYALGPGANRWAYISLAASAPSSHLSADQRADRATRPDHKILA